MRLRAFLGCFVIMITAMMITGVGAKTAMCALRGDPHLRQFGGKTASVPLPCLFKMAHTGIVQMDTNIQFEVLLYTSSGLSTVNGRYYVNTAQVDINVYDSTQSSPSVIRYEMNSVDIETSFSVTTTGEEAWTTTGSEGSYAAYLTKTYNHALKTGYLTFTDSSGTEQIEIEFYPRVSGATDNRGIKITLNEDAKPQNAIAVFPLSACSTFEDTSWGMAETNFSTTVELVMHGILGVLSYELKPQCTPARFNFQNFCFNPAKKKSAVSSCIYLLEPVSVACIEITTTGGTSGDAYIAFGDCMIDDCGFGSLGDGTFATALARLTACGL